MKTTEEKNREFAEFMGAKFSNYGDGSKGIILNPTPDGYLPMMGINGLKYHTSWDWLIPVMAKVYKDSSSLDNGKKWMLSLLIQSFNTYVVENDIKFAHRCAYNAIELINKHKSELKASMTDILNSSPNPKAFIKSVYKVAKDKNDTLALSVLSDIEKNY